MSYQFYYYYYYYYWLYFNICNVLCTSTSTWNRRYLNCCNLKKWNSMQASDQYIPMKGDEMYTRCMCMWQNISNWQRFFNKCLVQTELTAKNFYFSLSIRFHWICISNSNFSRNKYYDWLNIFVPWHIGSLTNQNAICAHPNTGKYFIVSRYSVVLLNSVSLKKNMAKNSFDFDENKN